MKYFDHITLFFPLSFISFLIINSSAPTRILIMSDSSSKKHRSKKKDRMVEYDQTVSKKKYRKALDDLEMAKADRLRHHRHWVAEKEQYTDQIKKLTEQIETGDDAYTGRNQMKASLYTGYMLTNSAQINTFLKSNVFPHYKFPPQAFAKYDPMNERSFFSQIGPELAIPDGVVERVYWNKKVVPMIGKRFQELRANSNDKHRVSYLGS